MRKSKYPNRTSVVFSTEMMETIKRISEKEEKSIGEVIREYLSKILPAEKKLEVNSDS